jgi:hypothetical protein
MSEAPFPIATQMALEDCAKEIRGLLRMTTENIIAIGARLLTAQSLLADHHEGQFQAWLRKEFGWSVRHAYNFIDVHKQFGGRANIAQLPIVASALYALSAPSAPAEAVAEAVERAEAGEKIGVAKAKELVKKHRRQPAQKQVLLREAISGLGLNCWHVMRHRGDLSAQFTAGFDREAYHTKASAQAAAETYAVVLRDAGYVVTAWGADIDATMYFHAGGDCPMVRFSLSDQGQVVEADSEEGDAPGQQAEAPPVTVQAPPRSIPAAPPLKAQPYFDDVQVQIVKALDGVLTLRIPDGLAEALKEMRGCMGTMSLRIEGKKKGE